MSTRGRRLALGSATLLGAVVAAREIFAADTPVSLAFLLGVAFTGAVIASLWAFAAYFYMRDVKGWGPPQDPRD